MKRIYLILLLFSIISCQKKEGTTTGNPLVYLSATSSQNSNSVALMELFNIEKWLKELIFPLAKAGTPDPMLDLNSNSIILDEGGMVLKEIEFKSTELADSSEIDGSEIKLSGPYAINLFSALPSTIGTTEVDLNQIRRIKMKLHRLESSIENATPNLLNNSIYFHGTIAGKEFALTSQEGTEIEIGGSNPISVKNNMNLLLSIRIVPLIAKIDLSSLLSNSLSAPVIVSDSNKIETGTSICPDIDLSATTIYDCFRKGLEQQADLGEDVDGSGELEIDENGVRTH